MNLGIFGGRLGRDSELNQLPSSGDQVLNFSVAVDVGTRDNPKTMWVECALYGKRAATLRQYLTVGTKVTVSGRLSMDQYRGKDGAEKQSLRLSVQEVDMHLPPRGEGQGGGQAPAARKPALGAPGSFDDDGDDLPF